MKLQDAMDIIHENNTGFMVHFEKQIGGFLHSGYFPDKHDGEELIRTEGEAWELAKLFAEKTVCEYVNIYVIDSSFNPVDDYSKKMILNR